MNMLLQLLQAMNPLLLLLELMTMLELNHTSPQQLQAMLLHLRFLFLMILPILGIEVLPLSVLYWGIPFGYK